MALPHNLKGQAFDEHLGQPVTSAKFLLRNPIEQPSAQANMLVPQIRSYTSTDVAAYN